MVFFFNFPLIFLLYSDALIANVLVMENLFARILLGVLRVGKIIESMIVVVDCVVLIVENFIRPQIGHVFGLSLIEKLILYKVRTVSKVHAIFIA